LAGRVLAVLARLVALLPWRALCAMGRVIGWLAGSLLRVRRAHVERSMAIAGIEGPSRQADAMYASLGRSAVEFLWLAGRERADRGREGREREGRGGEIARHVTLDPASVGRWADAVRGGRGVVIAASHTGNWDLAACTMARDLELLVVTKRLSVASIDRFWQSTRARQGVTLAGARGAMARSREVLRRGGAVAMMIDQVPSSWRHAVAVEFLGHSAFADRAPAALAAAARAPLVVAAARRAPSGDHVLHVLEVIEPDGRPARDWIVGATVAATRALDAFVRTYPGQWLWLHRRWKEPPGREDRRPAEADPGAHTAPVAAGKPAATLGVPWSKIRSSSPGEPSRAG
jgi:KDO2-lipid IV(A) lauroyltransferase